METVTQAATAAHYELSVMTLFMQADWVVKAVMIGLAAASIWCWAVIINRAVFYGQTRSAIKTFETAYSSPATLEELEASFPNQQNGLAPIFSAGLTEWRQSEQESAIRDGLRGRLELAVDRAVTEQSEALEQKLSVLATVGSAGPFIGLFGTVWGIMNAFAAIAAAEDTSLAVVAPGIAEALFATALGLLAAIPAVIAYNKLSADAAKISSKLDSFADHFLAFLSRKLDASETK